MPTPSPSPVLLSLLLALRALLSAAPTHTLLTGLLALRAGRALAQELLSRAVALTPSAADLQGTALAALVQQLLARAGWADPEPTECDRCGGPLGGRWWVCGIDQQILCDSCGAGVDTLPPCDCRGEHTCLPPVVQLYQEPEPLAWPGSTVPAPPPTLAPTLPALSEEEQLVQRRAAALAYCGKIAELGEKVSDLIRDDSEAFTGPACDLALALGHLEEGLAHAVEAGLAELEASSRAAAQ